MIIFWNCQAFWQLFLRKYAYLDDIIMCISKPFSVFLVFCPFLSATNSCHDAADVTDVLAHLVEAEERLRVCEHSSGIEGFSQSPAFVSETFCIFAGEKLQTLKG